MRVPRSSGGRPRSSAGSEPASSAATTALGRGAEAGLEFASLPGVLGVGVDVVDTGAFEEALSSPGSRFAEPGAVFTPRELRRAEARASQKGDGVADHLAAVWAIKEAALKAWLGALSKAGVAPPLHQDAVDCSELAVHHDAYGAPSVHLTGTLAQAFADSLGTLCVPEASVGAQSSVENVASMGERRVRAPEPENSGASAPEFSWHVSASHDGQVAVAFAALTSP